MNKTKQAIHKRADKQISQAVILEGEKTSYNGIEVVFQSKELFLIGFATILVAWAWVSIFSLILPGRSLSYGQSRSYPVRLVLQDAGRNFAYQMDSVVSNIGQASYMAGETVSYQVVELWNSSCLLQDQCNNVSSFVAKQGIKDKALAYLTGAIQEARSLQIPGKVVALGNVSKNSVVLGAKDSSLTEMPVIILRFGSCYVDSISMSALSAIEGQARSCR